MSLHSGLETNHEATDSLPLHLWQCVDGDDKQARSFGGLGFRFGAWGFGFRILVLGAIYGKYIYIYIYIYIYLFIYMYIYIYIYMYKSRALGK